MHDKEQEIKIDKAVGQQQFRTCATSMISLVKKTTQEGTLGPDLYAPLTSIFLFQRPPPVVC